MLLTYRSSPKQPFKSLLIKVYFSSLTRLKRGSELFAKQLRLQKKTANFRDVHIKEKKCKPQNRRPGGYKKNSCYSRKNNQK